MNNESNYWGRVFDLMDRIVDKELTCFSDVSTHASDLRYNYFSMAFELAEYKLNKEDYQ